MRIPAVLLLAHMLAGCTTAIATITGDDGGWLIGTWCPDNRTTNHAGVEVGLWPIRFYADGTYATFEDSGRWQYRDRSVRLTGTGATRVRRTDRFEQLGTTAMAWTRTHGTREIWRRCRATL